ncbi:unnamed protein product [Rhizoctonia solani]|uniref:Uncharacterized protein n=1 Tax=Rhizoctonia solani TaxID=456999 RepID=A0A8H3D0E0_9AGAM|nr:unnamed protein product [Rhizoctonia solani]CAE6519972.1 unnamed protein product [Rhizoctonia solani]
MAPPDPAVYSVDFERSILIPPPLSFHTSAAQTLRLPLQGTLGHVLHKRERASSCMNFSLVGPDSRAKHSQNIKRQHELQHADASISYRIIQKALSGPGNYVVQVDAKSLSPVIPTVKPEPELDKNSCSLIKSLSSSCSLPPVQTPRYDHGASFGIKVEPEEDFKLNPDPEAFDRKDLSQAPAMVPGVCSAENIQSDHSPPVTRGKDLHRCVKGHQNATKVNFMSWVERADLDSPQDQTRHSLSPPPHQQATYLSHLALPQSSSRS